VPVLDDDDEATCAPVEAAVSWANVRWQLRD
jgi:hypothetical protein